MDYVCIVCQRPILIGSCVIDCKPPPSIVHFVKYQNVILCSLVVSYSSVLECVIYGHD
jgi:hypothetical protein